MIQGPNVKKLIVHKMSMQMVPSGGTMMTALNEMARPGGIGEHARKATEWVELAIKAVRDAPGGHAYGDDEAIAGEILRQIDERKKDGR